MLPKGVGMRMSVRDTTFEQLRAVLQEAQRDHEQAKAALRAICSLNMDLPRISAGLSEPEGCHQMRDAFRVEVEARARHLDALHTFNFFAIYGMLPPDSSAASKAPICASGAPSLPAGCKATGPRERSEKRKE
jgi:hypothetical protein